jgi:hypothetical protein
MLNWRPVYEIESEIEQLQPDNARLAVLNSKIDALLRTASPPSPQAFAMGSLDGHTRPWGWAASRLAIQPRRPSISAVLPTVRP